MPIHRDYTNSGGIHKTNRLHARQ